MKRTLLQIKNRAILSSAIVVLLNASGFAQTNVFDDVIATSPNHTYLTAALQQEGLDAALQNNSASLTVFAPTNAAFDDLAAALNTNISGLLALTNLSDILLYHVLGSTVVANDISNGDIVTPLNTANTLKLTKTSGGSVYANQAMVSTADLSADNGVVHSVDAVLLPYETVVDVAIDNGFSTLTTAVVTAELLPALTDPLATFTVFAPTNDAFNDLAAALGTDLNGVLGLANLADVLTYHVLGTEVMASSINNGDIVSPLSATNTLKLTKTSGGSVYVNQAMVTMADISSDNGLVHVLDAVVLPSETVVDIALDNGFSTLATAVVTAELLPALTDPFSTLTVFAPTNAAFDSLASALGIDLNAVLALPNLADILTYHVLDSEVMSTDISNGDIVSPLSATNTLKLTKTALGEVYINQAMVSTANIEADNGIVHVLNAVVLPSETVVDVAIDNGFSTLATAVITAELLPALTDPFASLTVFAPTNEAFSDLATALGTDLNGILALPNLSNVLLYHVANGELMSTDLVSGSLNMLDGNDVLVDLTSDVKINQSNVTLADVAADNGVVHVIDAVLLYVPLGIKDNKQANEIMVFPNPTSESLRFSSMVNGAYEVYDAYGTLIMTNQISGNEINVSDLAAGQYILNVIDQNGANRSSFIKM